MSATVKVLFSFGRNQYFRTASLHELPLKIPKLLNFYPETIPPSGWNSWKRGSSAFHSFPPLLVFQLNHPVFQFVKERKQMI